MTAAAAFWSNGVELLVRSLYTDRIDGTGKIVENERSKITTLVLNVKETGTVWLNWTVNFPTKPILHLKKAISWDISRFYNHQLRVFLIDFLM